MGVSRPSAFCPLSALPVVQRALATLMLAMGLSTTPAELACAVGEVRVLGLNSLCCFGLMPLTALAVGSALKCDAEMLTGVVLLGAVSGGQASNLFALLANGDAALSVVATTTTTLLGVLATPCLAHLLLGGVSIPVDATGVLRSVASLVLVPLLFGVAMGLRLPALVARVAPLCPAVGVLSTLVLVAGGASSSASLLVASDGAWRAHAAAVALPLAGGAVALALAKLARLPERVTRTLTIETMIKSPTLAYVLALRHFSPRAAAVPAAAMVWLAALGAATASMWRRVPLPQTNDAGGDRSF